MKLSKRLTTIVDFVPYTSNFIADVGADHGLVSKAILEKYKDKLVFASDNKIGPFKNLEIALSSFDNAILSLSSGLEKLPNNVDTLIIAGMGGSLLYSIINEGKIHLSHLDRIIVSPHKEEHLIRKFLYESGYIIDREIFLKDDNIYYSVISFIKGKGKLTELEYKYGPFILKDKNADFIEYINKEISRIENLLNNKNISSSRKEELEKELKELKSL